MHDGGADMNYGPCRYDQTLQPISGKALPVYKGEVLRIIQVGGEQCVDFNCFNLHDYGERMSVGHMRIQGFRVKQGHFAISVPPYYRPMLSILHMAETCVTDLLGSRCDATLGEREYGLEHRTNCQDTLAESIMEYGLTPDDVHDSFNMWMHTVWDDVGFFPKRAVGPPGDYVDLLALMDVLAVPITCGSGDVGQISNFSFKPIRIQVLEASDDTRRRMDEDLARTTGFKNQRKPEEFGVSEIRADRELTPVPGYQPRFRAYPIVQTEIGVDLPAEASAGVHALVGRFGATDAEVIRAAFMLWCQQNRMKPHWVRP
jgi:uncharacterized protein YcgI (DUF1989 family)